MALSLLQGPVVSQHLGLTILQEQTAHSQSGPQKDEEERARSQCLFLGHTPPHILNVPLSPISTMMVTNHQHLKTLHI